MATFDDRYFETLSRPVRTRGCDCPGCGETGEFRAPKTRALEDYYFFCLQHVRAYNASWDYFAGMSGDQIENYTRSASVWERPSWPLGEWRIREQQLREKVQNEFFSEDCGERPAPVMPAAERDALAVLELKPPVDFTAIKNQYRVLVKLYHPDLHGGSVEAEERFKCVNQAFAILRKLYGADEAAA